MYSTFFCFNLTLFNLCEQVLVIWRGTLLQLYLESRKYGNAFHDDLWDAMDNVSTTFLPLLQHSCSIDILICSDCAIFLPFIQHSYSLYNISFLYTTFWPFCTTLCLVQHSYSSYHTSTLTLTSYLYIHVQQSNSLHNIHTQCLLCTTFIQSLWTMSFKLCPVSRITTSLAYKIPFHWISMYSRLVRAARETTKLKKWSLIPNSGCHYIAEILLIGHITLSNQSIMNNVRTLCKMSIHFYTIFTLYNIPTA